MILVDVNSHKFNFPSPWDKFVDDVDNTWADARSAGGTWRNYVDKQLAGVGGTNLMNTDYIEFIDECDALAFILKFGGVYEVLDSLPEPMID